MYTKTTKKINITVNPYFLEEQSEPEDQHYVWAYQVTINNLGKESVKLKNRYWKIIDSNGTKQEVKGEGVLGPLGDLRAILPLHLPQPKDKVFPEERQQPLFGLGRGDGEPLEGVVGEDQTPKEKGLIV